jgi:acyl-coenzyme A synthetase/AMP-(fatty) acid ligase
MGEVLAAHDAVAECAVIGVADQRRIADGKEYTMPSTIEDPEALETIEAAVRHA